MPWSARLKMKAGTNNGEGRSSFFGLVSILVVRRSAVIIDRQANTIRHPRQEGG
jgi:hypothetical protein